MQGNRVGFTSIDEYIAAFPKKTQKILVELRVTIKAAAPQAEEKNQLSNAYLRLEREFGTFGRL